MVTTKTQWKMLKYRNLQVLFINVQNMHQKDIDQNSLAQRWSQTEEFRYDLDILNEVEDSYRTNTNKASLAQRW